MKKLLFVISSLSAGGRERQFVQLLKSLNNENTYKLSVLVFNPKVFFTDIEQLNLDKLKIVDINVRDLECYHFMRKEINQGDYDLIYAADEYVAIHCLLAAIFTKTKVINASLRHGKVNFFNPRQLLRNITYRFSKYIIANSQYGYKGNHLCRNKNRFVLYNGIDDSFISNENRTSDYNKTLNFVSISRLHPIKDYDTVLDALVKLIDCGYCDFNYQIIGDGPEYESIAAKIKEKELEHNVTMLGKRKDVQELLLTADVLIHSSASEGCPNVVLEAMFSNTVVVASDTGGTPELISEGHGYLFKYKDVIDLYATLKSLYEDRMHISKVANTAYVYALNNYTTSKLALNFNKIVNKII